MRRGGLVLVVLAAVLSAPTARAASRSAPLVVAGLGGQSAVLTVPAGGAVVEYPFFVEPRLAGPDGTVGGVVIQRVRDGRLVGGTALLNVPGFDRALNVDLVDFERTKLPAGRYRLTLLGRGRQTVHLTVHGFVPARQLTAGGPAVPITRGTAGTSQTVDVWSEPLGQIRTGDFVLAGAGSGGANQQADERSMCVQAGTTAADHPCVPGDAVGLSPGSGGAAGWSGVLYRPGVLKPGRYVFSGHAGAVGPSSTSGHVSVVIALRG
jgi:hypothetical protein